MSFADHLVLWLHIGFAVFTVGPVTVAISSTPRYIRKRDVTIVRYLTRTTTIFTAGSLAVLILGIAAGQMRHELSKPWLTASMTLFLVALVLLVLIISDQRKAIRALEAETAAPDVPAEEAAGQPVSPEQRAPAAEHQASVERGRIAAMGGVVNLIWLAVLALMVWQP